MSDRDRVSAESAYASSVDSIQTEGPPSGRPFQSHLTQLLLTWNVTRSFVRSVIRPDLHAASQLKGGSKRRVVPSVDKKRALFALLGERVEYSVKSLSFSRIGVDFF